MKTSAILGAALIAALVPATPASAYVPPGLTQRVSLNSAGHEVGHGGLPAATCCSVISADGSHVAFMSGHDSFVPLDTNMTLDVFVRNVRDGVTKRASVASDESEAFGESYSPAISGDGRYVAFESNATTIVPGDENFSNDVFVRDLIAGTTELVSLAAGGGESTGYSSDPAISEDGRFVAFVSSGTDLVAGDTNAVQDVFVHDRLSGSTERVSVATGATQASGGATVNPTISADGQFIAFESTATNLVPGDTNGTPDVFVHDREAGTTERVSVGTGGVQANDRALAAAISGDGRYVAFHSIANNLVPADANAATDVFVRDRVAQATQRVSVSAAGVEHPGPSVDPAISADGRYVAYYVVNCSFIPGEACMSAPVGDDNATVDVVVRDLSSGSVERVSAAFDGGEPNSWSYDPTMSSDGRRVAFYSFATNIVEDDGNGVADVFVRDLGPALGIGGLNLERTADQASVSGWARFPAATVASASDPPSDVATPGGTAGAELTGARLIHRPEEEDLLAVLDLASLPHRMLGGGPGVVYGLSFTAGGIRYEVRVLRAAGATAPPAAPFFALYRCPAQCEEVARLAGGIGTTGSSVTVSVPLGRIGSATSLTNVRAFTALGEAAIGGVHPLDEVTLPEAVLAMPRVEVALAQAEVPPDQVPFDTAIAPANGIFSATLDDSSAALGEHRAWARACLGETCGPPRSA